MSRDGEYIISSSGKTIRILSITLNGTCLNEFNQNEQMQNMNMKSLSLNVDGRILASCGGANIFIWQRERAANYNYRFDSIIYSGSQVEHEEV